MKKYFTKEELLETIIDHLRDYSGHYGDLHHEVFNTTYYIEGTQKAKRALDEYGIYTAVGKVYLYEKNNFGDVYTDLSDPVKIANMLWYILGQELIDELAIHDFYEITDGKANEELIEILKSELQYVQECKNIKNGRSKNEIL